jgi:hypothetical protein
MYVEHVIRMCVCGSVGSVKAGARGRKGLMGRDKAGVRQLPGVVVMLLLLLLSRLNLYAH